MASPSGASIAVNDFSVARGSGNSWIFTPVSSAARQWAVDAVDFGLPNSNGAYVVLDPFAPGALEHLGEEGFGVRFTTQHDVTLVLEAALCLWEAMLEVRAENKAPEWARPMLDVWDEFGTVQMRHYAIGLAPEFLNVYDGLGGSEALEKLNLLPYDWEFIPAVLPQAEWANKALEAGRTELALYTAAAPAL